MYRLDGSSPPDADHCGPSMQFSHESDQRRRLLPLPNGRHECRAQLRVNMVVFPQVSSKPPSEIRSVPIGKPCLLLFPKCTHNICRERLLLTSAKCAVPLMQSSENKNHTKAQRLTKIFIALRYDLAIEYGSVRMSVHDFL